MQKIKRMDNVLDASTKMSTIKIWRRAYFALTLTVLSLSLTSADQQPTFRRRLDDLKIQLLSNYSQNVPPFVNEHEPVLVSIQYTMVAIFELNAVEQVISSLSYIVIQWRDPNLFWNTTEAGSAGEEIGWLRMKNGDIWTPTVMLLNSAQNNQIIDKYDSIVVYPTGDCQAYLLRRLSTSCRVDVTRYPFDTQVCHMMFAPIFGEYVNLTSEHADVSLFDRFDVSGQWEYLKEDNKRITIFEENFEFCYVVFNLTIRRQFTFYLLTVIFPMVLLSVTGACGFLLPLQCGEKVSFQVAIMVSISVFLNFINEAMPKTSSTIPRLAVYVDLLMTQSCLSFLATLLVLRGHYLQEKLDQEDKEKRFLSRTQPEDQTIDRDAQDTKAERDGSVTVRCSGKQLKERLRRIVRRWYCCCCCIPPRHLDAFFFVVFMSFAIGSPITLLL